MFDISSNFLFYWLFDYSQCHTKHCYEMWPKISGQFHFTIILYLMSYISSCFFHVYMNLTIELLMPLSPHTIFYIIKVKNHKVTFEKSNNCDIKTFSSGVLNGPQHLKHKLLCVVLHNNSLIDHKYFQESFLWYVYLYILFNNILPWINILCLSILYRDIGDIQVLAIMTTAAMNICLILFLGKKFLFTNKYLQWNLLHHIIIIKCFTILNSHQ